jgi:hypothetical protein
MTPILKDNSLANSYSRISGGTPIIKTTGGIGSMGGSQLKSKTQSAMERYEAEKAVEEQRLKDQYINQYGEAAYDQMMEAKNLIREKQKADIEQVKKYGSPSDYQMGVAQAEELKTASEKAKNYRYGLNVGRNGFQFPS